MNGRNGEDDDYDSQADDELLTQLRTAVQLSDPPPADLAERARRAFSWDAALEVLVEQQQTVEAAPALRRNNGPQRRDLIYRLPTISVSLTIDETGDGSYTITGSIKPSAVSAEIVESDGRAAAVDVDRKGRFVITTWADAAVIQLTTENGTKVRTPAIELTETSAQ